MFFLFELRVSRNIMVIWGYHDWKKHFLNSIKVRALWFRTTCLLSCHIGEFISEKRVNLNTHTNCSSHNACSPRMFPSVLSAPCSALNLSTSLLHQPGLHTMPLKMSWCTGGIWSCEYWKELELVYMAPLHTFQWVYNYFKVKIKTVATEIRPMVACCQRSRGWGLTTERTFLRWWEYLTFWLCHYLLHLCHDLQNYTPKKVNFSSV